jgi:SAM-dependent methyltransferase
MPDQMNTAPSLSNPAKHLRITSPSPWIVRYSSTIPPGGHVLDLACGGGRHSGHLLDQGYRVTAADKDTSTISERLEGRKNLTIITADLETGDDPFANEGSLGGQKFNGIIAVNYLYRPLMMALINALKPGGVLLYETFARGNEVYSRPRNPDHLLRSGELLDLAAGRLQVLAYEHGLIEADGLPCVRQRLIGVRDLALSKRDDGDPPAHQIGN